MSSPLPTSADPDTGAPPAHADRTVPPRVVAVPGTGLVDPSTPLLRPDDLGVLRGDGVFETMHVRRGRPFLIADHLARMRRSAARLDLPLPDEQTLAALVETAVGAWPAKVEGALRLVCTRGPETGGGPTVYATVGPVAPEIVRQRRDGIRVATASLGVAADARSAAPWLLGGVKSLSYAVNMASQRWSAANGFDDMLWLSSDGYALEGPTSTLVWRIGTTLCTVPADTGVLPGTTARHLLGAADQAGLRAEERMVRVAELPEADAVWFASSVRGLVPIRSLDDTPLRRDESSNERLRDLLGYPA